MADLVSILIPAYNSEKWIRDTIQSATNQTWASKEVIIVDDGSLDNTLKIAKAYESKDVKVISQENRGAAAARNIAYSMAQGDYIQWLDADDLLAVNKISEQMKVAEKSQNDLTLYSGPHGVFYWRWKKAKYHPNSLWQDLSPIDWLLKHFMDNLWMHPSVWLVGRKLNEKAGPWDERLSLNDDGEYFCRVVTKSESIKFVPDGKSYYRQSGFNQLSRKKSEKAFKSFFLSMKLCIQHLRHFEDSERTRRASLSLLQASLPYFYYENVGILEEIKALAMELGGGLMPPKFNLVQNLLGFKRGNKIMNTGRKLRLDANIMWDKLLYSINRKMTRPVDERTRLIL